VARLTTTVQILAHIIGIQETLQKRRPAGESILWSKVKRKSAARISENLTDNREAFGTELFQTHRDTKQTPT